MSRSSLTAQRAALSILLLVFGLASPGRAMCPQAEPATREVEINGTWVNYIGQPIEPHHLEGRAVLLMFFSPEDLAGGKYNWAQLRRFHHDFGGSRLLMLGILTGSPATAENLIEQYTLRFPIGVDTDFRDYFRLPDGPYQILLDRKANVHWSGVLGGVNEAVVLKAMQQAEKLTLEQAMLRLHVPRELSGKAGRVARSCEKGKLGSALRELEKMLASSRTEGKEREDALFLRERIEQHVVLLAGQIEADVARGEALRVERTLAALARELKGLPIGAAARQRIGELAESDAFQAELAADKEFEHVYSEFWRRGLTKVRKLLGRIVDKYPGTRAAQKAQTLMQSR